MRLMFKVAILGCENSHADGFLNSIKTIERFSDVEVIGVYSEESEAAQKLNNEYGVNIMEHYADLAGKVDGVMVTARHGGKHLEYIKPYIESGVPVFMDKPITIDIDEAVVMMREFEKNGVRYTGGSSLRYCELVKRLKGDVREEKGGKTVGGVVRAPIHEHSEYGGFYFYAQHLVEIVCEIFGSFPEKVRTSRTANGLTVIISYADYDVVGYYMEDITDYFAGRMFEEGNTAENIIVDSECFIEEFEHFHELLHGGKTRIDKKMFIAPVFIMNAIMVSLESGKEETICWERINEI